jgi:hypothetical protein
MARGDGGGRGASNQRRFTLFCLFALLGAFAPRIALLLLWIFTPLVNRSFGFWLWPLLGVIFLPFTTLFYVLVVAPLGPTNFIGWMVVFLGFLLDLRNYVDGYTNRSSIPGVSSYGESPNRVM